MDSLINLARYTRLHHITIVTWSVKDKTSDTWDMHVPRPFYSSNASRLRVIVRRSRVKTTFACARWKIFFVLFVLYGAPNRTWAWEIYGPPKKKVLCE